MSDFIGCAEQYGRIHQSVPTRPYIANLDTHVELLRQDGLVLPCTINQAEPNNTWVCSPLTTYGSYVIEEIQRYFPAPVALPLEMICRSYRWLLKLTAIDQVVTINNWMLSTNLFPEIDKPGLAGLIEQARQRWPQHAIWIRSLNQRHNSEWIAMLCEQGFELLPSRQVYLFHDIGSTRHANLERDLKLLKRTPLVSMAPEDFKVHDFIRVAQLYSALYLDKYSRLNPQYTAAFMQSWHESGLLQFFGFRDEEGVIQAVVGMFRQQHTITAPIVGYNTALPQSQGLYRLLMARIFEVAMRGNLNINLSAGAAHFKRLRGGEPEIEYSAVLTRHLNAQSRVALTTLRALTNLVGLPLMRKFQL